MIYSLGSLTQSTKFNLQLLWSVDRVSFEILYEILIVVHHNMVTVYILL